MSLLRSIIQPAVDDGIKLGIQQALAGSCDGYSDPEDRCPMTPPRCACLCVRYRALPWWRRIFQTEPPAPDNQECIDALVRQRMGIL